MQCPGKQGLQWGTVQDWVGGSCCAVTQGQLTSSSKQVCLVLAWDCAHRSCGAGRQFWL